MLFKSLEFPEWRQIRITVIQAYDETYSNQRCLFIQMIKKWATICILIEWPADRMFNCSRSMFARFYLPKLQRKVTFSHLFSYLFYSIHIISDFSGDMMIITSFNPIPYVCVSQFSLRFNFFDTCFVKWPWQPSANMVHFAWSSIPRSNVSLGEPFLAIPTSFVATPLTDPSSWYKISDAA